MATTTSGITKAQFKLLAPHQKLKFSSQLPIDAALQFDTVGRLRRARPGRSTNIRVPRAVNSWMMYRAFYVQCFSGLQQKDASPQLKVLWDNDPFKAKWAILASAYTKIRDYVGKLSAPLARFLRLACPKIGVISPEEYLQTMGWSLEAAVIVPGQGVPMLHNLPNSIKSTSMTTRDVVGFVGEQGYMSLQATWAIQFRCHNDAHHGLLAATPYLGKPDYGFALPLNLGNALHVNYEWTGSLSDLYNPDEGDFNLQQSLATSHLDQFNTFNIYDPVALDYMLQQDGVVQNGYLAPLIPELEMDYGFN